MLAPLNNVTLTTISSFEFVGSVNIILSPITFAAEPLTISKLTGFSFSSKENSLFKSSWSVVSLYLPVTSSSEIV